MKFIGFRDFRDGTTNAETQKDKAIAQAPKEPMHKLKGAKVQQGPSASKRVDERYQVVTSKYSLEPGKVGERTSEDEVHSKHKSLKAAAKKLTTVIRTKRDANKYEILDTETGKRMSRNQARDLGEEQIDEISKELAGRYIKKSMEDSYGRGYNSGLDVLDPSVKKTKEQRDSEHKKIGNRFVGVHRAVKRLTKD